MKPRSMSKKKRIVIILFSIVLCAAMVMTGMMICGKSLNSFIHMRSGWPGSLIAKCLYDEDRAIRVWRTRF